MKSFKLFGLFMLLAAVVTFSSCGSDDDDKFSEDYLIGTQEFKHSTGYEIYQGDTEEWDYEIPSGYDVYKINADGTGINTWYDDEDDKYYDSEFEWSYNENSKTLIFYGDIYTVKTLTKKKLVIETYEKDDDFEYYSKDTFVKK